jgi:hypothetical protein
VVADRLRRVGLRELYQIDLYLQPFGVAAALETHGRILWEADALAAA